MRRFQPDSCREGGEAARRDSGRKEVHRHAVIVAATSAVALRPFQHREGPLRKSGGISSTYKPVTRVTGCRNNGMTVARCENTRSSP
jgi:hypothetical protein